MAFLNAMGRVSRHGQWRLRRVLRASYPDGRLDLSDEGLIDLSAASEVALTVTPRPPLQRRYGCGDHPFGASPGLRASTLDGTLHVSNPGLVEAVFATGWSRSVPPGLYDVRITVNVGPESQVVFDEPVEIA